MHKINSDSELRAAITALEYRQVTEGKMLKAEFNLAYESIKPINFIRNTVKEINRSSELKTDLLTLAVGVGVGYLSKILFKRVTHQPLKKLLGAALLFGVSKLISRHDTYLMIESTPVETSLFIES
ncbi:hypothetical protein [Haliscomenobacter sp.]|uniref:hypothetical protein n=1 Tax=Haliscomenobacter sp. TaxID=2717303 RepID=UPI003364CA76